MVSKFDLFVRNVLARTLALPGLNLSFMDECQRVIYEGLSLNAIKIYCECQRVIYGGLSLNTIKIFS